MQDQRMIDIRSTSDRHRYSVGDIRIIRRNFEATLLHRSQDTGCIQLASYLLKIVSGESKSIVEDSTRCATSGGCCPDRVRSGRSCARKSL